MMIHEPIMGKYFIEVRYNNFVLFEYSDKLKIDKKTNKTYRKKIEHGHFGNDLPSLLLSLARMLEHDKYSATRTITIRKYITELAEIQKKLKDTIYDEAL